MTSKPGIRMVGGEKTSFNRKVSGASEWRTDSEHSEKIAWRIEVYGAVHTISST